MEGERNFMNYVKSNHYVKKIVDSKDRIEDQLIELSKFKNRKGVRQYIDSLIFANTFSQEFDSEYILYCIMKYYYGLEVKRGKAPLIIPDSLGIITPAAYNIDFIANLLNSKDNIIDQCKVLKEHQDSIDVQTYISQASTYYGYDAPVLYGLSTEYEMYCINKYFHGYDVPFVKSNHVRLGAYTKIRNCKKNIQEESKYTPFEDVKKGDKVKILTGPFQNLQAIIDHIDLDHHILTLTAKLFEQDTTIELAEGDKILKEEDIHE